MTMLSLIVGNVGAGKSTYASNLAQNTNAYIFSGDQWFKTLFFPDMPSPPSYEWALERTERIELQICLEALKMLARDIPVILDLGFFAQKQRTRVMTYFLERQHSPQLHYLDVEKDTRWQRVDQRNTMETETFQFHVSRQTFDFCETLFEPLEVEELRGAVLIEN